MTDKITIDRSLLRQALDAFEVATAHRNCDRQEIIFAQHVLREALAAPQPPNLEESCPRSPTGEHSESWFANNNCEYCNAGAQPDAPLYYASQTQQSQSGWFQSGALLYRLTDERKPQNRDEIRVTMADGSYSDESCTRQAGELIDRLSAPQRQPLTEAEIARLNQAAQDQGVSGISPSLYFARAIEQAHGIGGKP